MQCRVFWSSSAVWRRMPLQKLQRWLSKVIQTFNYFCGSKLLSFLGKKAITTLKLIQNANVGGVLENSGYLLPHGHWDFQNWSSTNIWNKFCFHCKSWKCRGTSKDCILRAENSDHFWRGGWQLYASFSQSFLLQFWKSQCSSGSKYPEFSKTPPAFAFWMILKVVMAVFPRNDIFFGTPCILSILWALLSCYLRYPAA